MTSATTATLNEQIEDILAAFDFERVMRIMAALDWRWDRDERPPAIGRVVQMARARLVAVSRRGVRYSSCGGFTAVRLADDPPLLALFFGCDYVADEDGILKIHGQ